MTSCNVSHLCSFALKFVLSLIVFYDMGSDDGSSDEVQICPVFRPKARQGVSPSSTVDAKRVRRLHMEADGYSEWQMNRAEAQRVDDGVADTEGVTQSVYRCAVQFLESDPVPDTIAPPEEVSPQSRGFLPASIPGVTVCRPWADNPEAYPLPLVLPGVVRFCLRPYPEGPFPRIPESGFFQEQPEGYDPAAILRRATK